FLGSRLLTAFLQQRGMLPDGSEAWMIAGLALVATVILGNMAGTQVKSTAAQGLVVIGALLGPIFPNLVGVLFKEFDHDHGAAYGAMFAIGSTGSLILPPWIGGYARRTSVHTAMRIPTLIALLLSAA